MKLILLAVVAHVLFVCSVFAQADGLDNPIVLEEAPIELEDWRAEFNASAAAAFSAYSK